MCTCQASRHRHYQAQSRQGCSLVQVALNLKAGLVHDTISNGIQAQPVRVGQPLAIQPSDAPLTVPDAPRLALHERSASRQAFDDAVAKKQKQAEVSFIAA